MTVRTWALYAVACDTCDDNTHHDPAARSSMEARVSAGVAGWRYQSVRSRPGGGRRPARDICPDCAVPEAEIVVEGST